MGETQESVHKWAVETFGERDMKYRALMVPEEAVELGSACGLTGLDMEGSLRAVLRKIKSQDPGTSSAPEEAADTLSCISSGLFVARKVREQ